MVRPGQQLGEVGSRGNSTGCHLHFEVHPKGGSIYEDGVDPSEWLQTHVGQEEPAAQAAAAPPSSTSSSTPGSFVMASFNVLGHSHTQPGGHHARVGVGRSADARVRSLCSTGTPSRWSACRSCNGPSAGR